MWHLEKERRTLKINQLTFQKYLLTTLHLKTFEDFFLSGIIPSKNYEHLLLLQLSMIPSYSKKKRSNWFNCLENKIGMFWLSFYLDSSVLGFQSFDIFVRLPWIFIPTHTTLTQPQFLVFFYYISDFWQPWVMKFWDILDQLLMSEFDFSNPYMCIESNFSVLDIFLDC